MPCIKWLFDCNSVINKCPGNKSGIQLAICIVNTGFFIEIYEAAMTEHTLLFSSDLWPEMYTIERLSKLEIIVTYNRMMCLEIVGTNLNIAVQFFLACLTSFGR